jgi:hypothetical protein
MMWYALNTCISRSTFYIHTYIHTYRCCSIGSHLCIRCLSWRIELKCFPWWTFRFNGILYQHAYIHTFTYAVLECACTPYNADFDGDEMNIHLHKLRKPKLRYAIAYTYTYIHTLQRHNKLIHIQNIHTEHTYIHTCRRQSL